MDQMKDKFTLWLKTQRKMYQSKDQRKQEYSKCKRIITNDTKRFNMAGKCENKHSKADVIRTKTDKVTMKRHPECKKSESNRDKTNRDKRDLDKWKLSSKHSRKRSFTIISLADMCTKTILMKACSKPYTEILVNIQIDKTILLKDNYCQDAKTVNVRDSISSIDDYLLNRKTDTNVLCQKTKWTDKSKSSVSDISTPKSLTVDYKRKHLNECEKSTKLDSHSISNDKKSLRDTESFHKKSYKVHNTSGNSNVRSHESNSSCGRTLLKSQKSNSNCGGTLLKSPDSNSNCGRTLLQSQESISNCERILLKSQEVFTESDRNIFAVLGAKALGEVDKLTETTKFKTEPVDTSYDNSTSLIPTCSSSSGNIKSEKWTEKIKVKTESIDNSFGNLNSFTSSSINKSNFEFRVETTQEHRSMGSASPLRQTAEKNENDVTSDYEGSSTGLPSEDEDIKEEALEPMKCSSLQTDIQPEFDEDLPMLISPQRKKMKLEEKTTCAQLKTPKDNSPKDPKTISNNLKITEKKEPDTTRRSDLKDIIRTKECTSLSKKSVHEKHRSDDFKSIKTLSFESSRANLDTNSEKLTQKAYSSEILKHSEKSNPSKSRHISTKNDTKNLSSYQKKVEKNSSNKSNVTLNDIVIKENIKTQNGPFKPDAGVHLEYKHNIKSKEIECKMQAVAVDIFKLANEFQKVKKSYSETTKTEPETIRLDAIVRDECKDKILSNNDVDKAVSIKNKSIISDVQNKMKISTLIDECKRNITTHGNKTNEIARSKSTDKSSTCKNLNKNERKGERKVDDNHRVTNSRDHNRDNRVLNERSRKHDVKYNVRRCDEKYHECRRYDEEKMRRCDGNRRYANRDFLRADDATKLVGRNGSGAFDKDAIYKPYESGTPIRMSTERDEYKILGNEEKQSCQKQNERNENSSALIQMNNTEDINQRESDSIIAICQKSTDESKIWKDSENDLQILEGKSIKTNVSVEENHPSGENVLVLRAPSKDTEETKDPITNSALNENFTSMDVTGNESDLVSTNPTEEEDMLLDMSDEHELTSGRSDTNEFFGEHDTWLSTMSDNSSLQQSNMQQLDTHLNTNSKITLETDNKSTEIVKQNLVTVSTSVQTHEDALSNQIDHKNVSIPYNDTPTTHFSMSTNRSSFDTHNIKESSLENPIKKKTLLPTPTNSEQNNEQLINLRHNVNKLTTSRPTNASSKWEKITPTLSAKEEIQELSPMEEIQDLSPKEEIFVLKSAFISTSVDDAQDVCTVISNEVVSNTESSTAPKHLVKFSDINVVSIATSENPTPGLVDTTTPNNNAQKNIDNILMAKANPVAIKIEDNDARQTDIVVSDKKFQKPVCTTTSNTNVPTKPLDNMTITKDSQKTDYATTTVHNAFEITILDKNNTSTSVCIQKYKKDVITGTRKISATFRDISEKVPVCNKPAVNDALTSDQTSTSHNDAPKRVYTATHDEEVNKNTKLPSLASVDLQTHSSKTTNNDVSQTQCSLNCEKFIPESVCVETSSNKPLSTITGVTLSSISVNDRKNATPTSVESETSTDNMPCSSDIQKQVCITADTLVPSSKTGIVVKQGQSDEEYPANNKKGDNDVVDLLAEHIPKQSPCENKRKIKLLTNTCFLSKKVKIIRSTINRPRIRPKMSPSKRNIVTDASDNISVTIKNEDKEKKDVRQSKTDTEGNNEVKKKDSVVIDLTDEESPKKSNNCKRKIDLEPASESKDNKRGRIEQNNRKIKSKVTIAKQNEIANRTDDTGPKQMRDRKDTDKRRTTENKKKSKYESERNCYKRNDETNRDCNYGTSAKRSSSKEYQRKYESSEYDRNFQRKRKYANEHEVPSHLMMNQQPMNDISYVGLKVEPTTAHARCFNEVVGYAYDFMRGYCDYNEISSQYVTPVRRFRTNLMRQLKATFDRYFYGPNNPYDPIYSLTGPQPRFRNEDIMIRTILHTIKKPHIRRGTDCHSCQFDDVIGYEGYKIPCFWVKVEFREGEFLRALPILDRSYAY
ncbi:Hypothetical predicted protein [Mytilus galloprovincialis]|uniref:Uncharacterized protein n=2 Tax=Mytilus galloprovincialis TaxID=29158 RepID=A0A8B6E7A9_MYTGA|nr:Hypothetical predicted protein [Mytilus galloprovincialis]